LTVEIHPARETSGDFYDMFMLPDGRLGFLIADVADKGMGAALFMALSRTVLRIFVLEHGQRPELALRAANRHILRESSSGLFVTLFLGILEPATGKLVYCNAGHNPPLLQSRDRRKLPRPLGRTGMPVGVSPDAAWSSLSLASLGCPAAVYRRRDRARPVRQPSDPGWSRCCRVGMPLGSAKACAAAVQAWPGRGSTGRHRVMVLLQDPRDTHSVRPLAWPAEQAMENDSCLPYVSWRNGPGCGPRAA
jgi:hypothetical protein